MFVISDAGWRSAVAVAATAKAPNSWSDDGIVMLHESRNGAGKKKELRRATVASGVLLSGGVGRAVTRRGVR